MPVVQPKSLNNTFDEIRDQGSVTTNTNSDLELSDLGVPSQDDVPLLLMALDTENIILSEMSESEINISANSSVWNNEIESIFSIPQSTAPKKPKKRALTSHRLLTSDEVINEKREMLANKEKLEQLKLQRKLVREQKLANKKRKAETS